MASKSVNIWRQGVTQAARFVRLGAWTFLGFWASNVAALNGDNKQVTVAAIVGAAEVAFRRLVPATDESSVAAAILRDAASFIDPQAKAGNQAAPGSQG